MAAKDTKKTSSSSGCKFCKTKTESVTDDKGTKTGEKRVVHDVSIPHPTLFGFSESKKYFK